MTDKLVPGLAPGEEYLLEDEKYQRIVELLKKIYSSLVYTAPEALEGKYFLLAEKYGRYFTFEEDEGGS